MKNKILSCFILLALISTNIYSQSIYGNSYKNIYWGFHDPTADNFPLKTIPVFEPPFFEPTFLNFNFSSIHGEMTMEFFPEVNNIWQTAYGHKIDLGISNSSFLTWEALSPQLRYLITDSINPYPHNIEHSVKLKFDTIINYMEYPIIHDLNISLAEGDTLFLDIGNDNLHGNIDSVFYQYAFAKNNGVLSLYETASSPNSWSYLDPWDLFGTSFYDNIIILKLCALGGVAGTPYWHCSPDNEFDLGIGINYLKLTLKSGENNQNNAGVSFGGFFIYDSSTLSVNDELVTDKKISLYPNPFSETLNITSDLNFDFIEILDISGRALKRVDNISNENQLNLASLKSGVYFIRFYYNSSIVKTEKLIKQ